MRKPVDRYLHDGTAKCVSEEYDDKGGGAFGVEVDAFLYSSQEIKKLILFLEKSLKWIQHKEKCGLK